MFNKWCNWAGLIICVDKCSTFGVKKNGNSSTQSKQYLQVNKLFHQLNLMRPLGILLKHFRIQ